MKEVKYKTQITFNLFLEELVKDLTDQLKIPLQVKVDIRLGAKEEDQNKIINAGPALQKMLNTGMQEFERNTLPILNKIIEKGKQSFEKKLNK